MFGGRFRWGFGLVGLLLIAVAVVGIGFLAYNAGVSEGVAQAGDLPDSELERVGPLYRAPYGFRPFGIGFGFLGCLVPLLILFLLFGGMRMLFMPWRMGRWGRGWGKHPQRWGRFREQAEEWHREMHEAEPGDQADA